jgi:hypothetical protein
MTALVQKRALHLGVRFYRVAGVELVLVPLVDEVASFVRMAGDGYFLVVLAGPPGTAYPINLHSAASLDPAYLAQKFRLPAGGSGYSADELAAVLAAIAEDLDHEKGMDG